MISTVNARAARPFLIAMCLGCLTSVAQQDTPSPANSSVQTSQSAPAQDESQSTPDQSQTQNSDGLKSQTETKTQTQTKPAKKQQGKAGSAVTNPSRHAAPKRTAVPAPPVIPKKIVVRQGGAEEPTAQIVTGMTAEESDRQRREAELLLSTTDEKLKEIAPRPLDAQQEETVSQIHSYMEGSRSALKQGDVSRAHTLALKAGLLADDLAKH